MSSLELEALGLELGVSSLKVGVSSLELGVSSLELKGWKFELERLGLACCLSLLPSAVCLLTTCAGVACKDSS